MARRLIPAILALILLAIPASGALAQSMMAPVTVSFNSTLGQILTDPAGNTLYWWAGDDTPGTSKCVEGCPAAWPPLLVDQAGMDMMMAMDQQTMDMMMMGPIGAIMRPEGTMQVTWMGHPLYHFVRDAQPGDTNGNGSMGFGALWSVVSLADMMM
ncbi:MAG: hypothetical protein QOF51_3791 [Chloroflexota bacterium]|jgi:predicted lipoprotein with Yx(FWY)xxD motif|nr:hypothetical protein [Chloroflexota bacterium]